MAMDHGPAGAAWWRGCLLAWAALSSLLCGEAAGRRPRPRLRCVTFMNEPHRHFAYLQVSAEAYSLYPQVIGYGMEAWWPDGLGVKINALRDFVFGEVEDEDVLLFVDAFDVLIFGTGEEILGRFEELERRANSSLFFNAEEYCFPRFDGLCDPATYPPSPFRWRFLNSGVIIGRGHTVKAMLRDPVPNVIRDGDQTWYQRRFRSPERDMLLDTSCFLICAVTGATEENGVLLQGRRISLPETGTSPLIVHFVGVGHWPRWPGWTATTNLHEAFRALYPEATARLLDSWRLEAQLGSTHTMVLVDGTGWWRIMRSVLCIQCRLLGSREHECEEFPSLLHRHCLAFTTTVSLIAMVFPLCFFLLRPGGCESARSLAAGVLARAVVQLPASLGRRSRKLPELIV